MYMEFINVFACVYVCSTDQTMPDSQTIIQIAQHANPQFVARN